MSLEIKEPFNVRDYRKVRKFLQLSSGEIGVICNSYEVFGLGKIKSSYDPETESIFEINFKGIHCWDVEHNGEILMQMRYGLPGFETESINKNKFFTDVNRIFKQISSDKIELLYQLSLAATLQKKGALLIFSKEAKKEANRLKSQCIGIKPIKLDTEIVLKLSNVDGGILIDTDGYAHANGVILDGIVNIKGDSARGSRYNSAVTYYENFGKVIPTIIVIVSEDGMVNIKPNLMPQIKHSEIIQVIKILESLNSVENFDRGAFYQAMDWLKNRQFYLINSECTKINKLKNDLESLDEKSGHTMWVKHDDFEPNTEMNKSYYYNEN